MITVVIPFSKNITNGDAENDAENDAEKSLEEMVIELIKEDPKISKIKMAEKTGKSKPTIERMLKTASELKESAPTRAVIGK